MVPKMWSGVPPEDILTPEAALPAQFYDIWHKTRAVSPERSLVLSVMWQAVIDLRKFRFARRRQHQRLFMDAYQWVTADDNVWPYSFLNLCQTLNLNPDLLRRELLSDAIPATETVLETVAEVEEAA